MIADLSADQIKVGISALADFYGSYKAGKVRVLATSGKERSLSAPELPTFAESGYAELVGDGWLGLYAPAHTPLPITSALSAEVSAILALPDVRDRIITMGMEPRATTPAGLRSSTTSNSEVAANRCRLGIQGRIGMLSHHG